ncbi:glycoside hydrolase family protein [Flavisolibacter nicotianae]|uniref:hypothetical protein n=1 Tax=Flavisolibacter nicotianae TaxID=2364882 RepID=UPI0019698076|nr:hypothetical protein [Flavisolibacter nicotianae]
MKRRSIFLFSLSLASGLLLHAQTKLPFTVKQPVFKKASFYITKFGAKPDGLALNTESFNTPINTCSQKGGAVVLIPQGLWLTGPIVLKSNVNLYLKKNALLQFTKGFSLLQDETAAQFYQRWTTLTPVALVQEVLQDEQFWGMDLGLLPGFGKAVQEKLNLLLAGEIKDAIRLQVNV